MLYCDLVCDAMNKGLGAQRSVAFYSIISNILDISLMFVLLPRLGLDGYYLSFTLTHAITFLLGLRRVLSISGAPHDISTTLGLLAAALFAALGGSCFTGPIRRTATFCGLFFALSFYLGLFGRGDLCWFRNMIIYPSKQPNTADATNS